MATGLNGTTRLNGIVATGLNGMWQPDSMVRGNQTQWYSGIVATRLNGIVATRLNGIVATGLNGIQWQPLNDSMV